MDREEDDLRSLASHRCDRFPDFRDDVANDELPLEIVAVPDHRTGSRGADDPDLHSLPLDDPPAGEGSLTGRRVCVRGEEWKRGLRLRAPEERQSIVELVVAHRGR